MRTRGDHAGRRSFTGELLGADESSVTVAADTGVDRAYMSELEREQGNATVDLLDRLAAGGAEVR